MVNRIKEMMKRLSEILEEKGRFQLAKGSVVVEEADERDSFSAFDECEVYGRDEDRERIVDFLLHMDTEKKLYVLPIVGLGGLDFTKWEMLQNVLSCGGLGSKIIVTTRSEQVTRIMSTLEPHRLQGLRSEDCWKLFRQRAFRSRSNRNVPRLENIGREIVDKCGGSPLAAKALGCLMGSS
ncbi:putative disease resistance protein RGA1 [Typha angustifolia]|uniref:putative disease resistance protein RGA1 n=1 Tax=Typha angustifolia TaxID=59011 RepID=UPI003C2D08F7